MDSKNNQRNKNVFLKIISAKSSSIIWVRKFLTFGTRSSLVLKLLFLAQLVCCWITSLDKRFGGLSCASFLNLLLPLPIDSSIISSNKFDIVLPLNFIGQSN